MSDDSLQEKNIAFVQEAIKQYKQNENNKIIQFLHITTLMLIGILSKCNRDDEFAVYVAIAILLMPFAYAFFYLADLNSASINVYTYLFQPLNSTSNDNKALLVKADEDFRRARRLCVSCLFLVYFCIALYLINMYTFNCFFTNLKHIFVSGSCLVFAYLLYNFIKQFHW